MFRDAVPDDPAAAEARVLAASAVLVTALRFPVLRRAVFRRSAS
ncbi:hypothetical protein [Streptomyces sp. NPDC001388]